MLNGLVKKIFGSRNERILRKMESTVAVINQLETEIQKLSDQEIKAKTDELRSRYQQGETLEKLLPEAFGLVREASVRTLGLRHFDVQLIGGMVLHQGKIAEMRTGEGKTLVGTLAAYLNTIPNRGVHIITVNDYLAKRDSEWMRPIYEFLGLTVGVIIPNMSLEDKKAAYQCDIVYGTNNEFGFDYLRDNMAFNLEGKVQGDLYYAVIDEVDSILIDEARTPLIISGAAEDSSELYIKINKLIPLLKKEEDENPGDYTVDEKTRQVYLTEDGHQHIEEILIREGLLAEGTSLYNATNISLMHHVNASLRAHALFHRDVEYLIQNNQVVIVDEHTGRTMPGRRWSDGLHQAVEAKEGVPIQSENQTLASITFQNYFRLYDKLSGMTGTADTEAYEFQHIYHLEVVVIPTNNPMIRKDLPDLVYLSQQDKFDAILADIQDCCQRQQPVLVGTASIEASELLDKRLNKEKIPHQVLNAKFHEKEAHIIAEAGRPGVVTIATNMAGRGTDIVLGGSLDVELQKLGEDASETNIQTVQNEWQQRHDQVIAAGGLRIIGSERHESRRIDNQLRGRAGRQGDPGSSRFYLSLEDNLMRIFAPERAANVMKRLGMKPGEAIEHPWISKAIENAQRKVEGRNFDIRKQLLEYDDVANDQRKVIYKQRADMMVHDDLTEMIDELRDDVISNTISLYIPPESIEEQWDVPGLCQQLEKDFALKLDIESWLKKEAELDENGVRERILAAAKNLYQQKQAGVDPQIFKQVIKSLTLRALDNQWRDHLAAMDHLRQGIHLRGYAQKDPKQEYKREAFEMFSDMLERVKCEIISTLSWIQIKTADDATEMEREREREAGHIQQLKHESMNVMQAKQGNSEAAAEKTAEKPAPFVRHSRKVGRNEPCPCGSGKKYKTCHGRIQ